MSNLLMELAVTITGTGLFLTGIICIMVNLIFEVNWKTLLNPLEYYGPIEDYLFEVATVFLKLVGLVCSSLFVIAIVLNWFGY